MAGKTGYTAIPNSKVPDFGTDITSAFIHFDNLTNQAVPTAASLPGSGNWLDRRIVATDTKIVYRHDGSNWKAWASAPIARSGSTIPFVTTVGNGALIAHYQYVEGMVHEWGRFTHGSTSVVSASTMTLTSAVALNSTLYGTRRVGVGGGVLEDIGSATFDVKMVVVASTTAITFMVSNSSGTYTTEVEVNNTIPLGTWATNDTISWDVWYMPA